MGHTMLTKVEGTKPWAKFEQVFTDGQLAADKAMELEEDGWEVKIIPLGNVTVEQYGIAVFFDCMTQLELIHGTDLTSH